MPPAHTLRRKNTSAVARETLLLGLVALLTLSPRLAIADEAENSCVICHAALPDPLNKPVEGMKHDIHATKGLSCADCHGGDPTLMDLTSMAPEKGFRGAPKPAAIPQLCGRCHADEPYMRRFNSRLPTDQLAQYWTSTHGQRLRQGDTKVATCVSCHGVHGIIPPARADSPTFPANVPDTCGHCHSSPQYMAGYKIPTDQVEEYKRSVHAQMVLVQRDFSAPVCNSCHGNHGAYPPGVTSIAEVCGQCHVNDATLFTKSPHKAAFDRLGLPECVTCHGNHEIRHATDAMLGGNEGTVCRRCHQPDSPGYTVAVKMRQAIDQLKSVMSDTEAMLAKASQMGMEVSDEEYNYRQDIRPQLVKIRTETHLADADSVLEIAQEGIKAAEKSDAAAKAKAVEATARRRNLLMPLAIIVLVMGLFYLKLRQLERPGNSNRPVGDDSR